MTSLAHFLRRPTRRKMRWDVSRWDMTRCCFNVGPASQTVAQYLKQHWANCCGCWYVSRGEMGGGGGARGCNSQIRWGYTVTLCLLSVTTVLCHHANNTPPPHKTNLSGIIGALVGSQRTAHQNSQNLRARLIITRWISAHRSSILAESQRTSQHSLDLSAPVNTRWISAHQSTLAGSQRTSQHSMDLSAPVNTRWISAHQSTLAGSQRTAN